MPGNLSVTDMEGARARLGAMQVDIARSLLRGEDCGLAIPYRSLEKARGVLLGKRRSAAAQTWPALAAALGREFGALFTDYASEHPLPQDASPVSDGRQFARWLGSSLPLEAAEHVVHFDLFYAQRARPLMRRGCLIRVLRLKEGVCAGVRIPGLLWRCVVVPYPRSPRMAGMIRRIA